MSNPHVMAEREAYLEPIRANAAKHLQEGNEVAFNAIIDTLMEEGYLIEAQVMQRNWDNAQEVDV